MKSSHAPPRAVNGAHSTTGDGVNGFVNDSLDADRVASRVERDACPGQKEDIAPRTRRRNEMFPIDSAKSIITREPKASQAEKRTQPYHYRSPLMYLLLPREYQHDERADIELPVSGLPRAGLWSLRG